MISPVLGPTAGGFVSPMCKLAVGSFVDNHADTDRDEPGCYVGMTIVPGTRSTSRTLANRIFPSVAIMSMTSSAPLFAGGLASLEQQVCVINAFIDTLGVLLIFFHRYADDWKPSLCKFCCFSKPCVTYVVINPVNQM